MEDNEKTEVIPGLETTEDETTEGKPTEGEAQVETPEVVALRKELEETKVKLKEQERVASKHANKAFELESRFSSMSNLQSEQAAVRQELRQIAQELGIELKPVEAPKPETKATETTQTENPAITAFRDLLDEEGIKYDDPEMLKTIEGKDPADALKAMRKAIRDKERKAMEKELNENSRKEFQRLAKAHGLTTVETGVPTAPGVLSNEELGKLPMEQYAAYRKKQGE